MSIRKHITIIDETLNDDGGQWEREKSVEAMVRQAVEKTGLSLTDGAHAVVYSEEDREIQISLYEEASLMQLKALSVFGDITVRAHASYRDVLLIQITSVPADVHTMKIS